MKVENDKFYTEVETAKYCLSLIKDISEYDLIIEPSAGNGSFSNLMKGCLALDISPEGEGIIEKDFFTLEKQSGKIIVIGNPPFGTRNNLSRMFIKHSIYIGAETIAFVLPDVYNKFITQRIFPDAWKLISVNKIKDNAFFVGTSVYHVPCSFFIWTKKESSLNLRKSDVFIPEEFSFLKRGDLLADFCINGNSGKIKSLKEVTNPKAEHYIKSSIPQSYFENLDFNFNSSVNGGVSWIGQYEIIEAFNNKSSFT